MSFPFDPLHPASGGSPDQEHRFEVPGTQACPGHTQEAEDEPITCGQTFAASPVRALRRDADDDPSGEAVHMLVVPPDRLGAPGIRLDGGSSTKPSAAFRLQVETERQEEPDRRSHLTVGRGGPRQPRTLIGGTRRRSWHGFPRVSTEAEGNRHDADERMFGATGTLQMTDLAASDVAGLVDA
jgi:2-polyprenyl-6-hydroxyphenyl methylase/3-demethylubiquinone-9 3-methyltransferase